jgi:hypothetical protein
MSKGVQHTCDIGMKEIVGGQFIKANKRQYPGESREPRACTYAEHGDIREDFPAQSTPASLASSF